MPKRLFNDIGSAIEYLGTMGAFNLAPGGTISYNEVNEGDVLQAIDALEHNPIEFINQLNDE